MKSNYLLESAVIGAFLLFPYAIFAQKWSTIKTETQKTPCSIFASFLMQGPYPGLRIGVELPLKETNYEQKGTTKTRERAAQFSLGMYHHGGFHTNFFLTSDYVFRRLNKRGFITEFKTGLALSRTFLGATAYSVNESGQVSRENGAGNYYFMPSLNFGIGKDFSKTASERPLSIYGNFNATGLLPYNGFILPLPIFEIGARFKLGNLPKMAVKVITKQS
jgi:hypothetical protein